MRKTLKKKAKKIAADVPREPHEKEENTMADTVPRKLTLEDFPDETGLNESDLALRQQQYDRGELELPQSSDSKKEESTD